MVALFAMVKGADELLHRSEKMGRAYGLSPFFVGVTIVGIGTSLPELASSVAAVFAGASEIVVANAIGSNVANILLVIGVAAIIGKRLTVTKNLIDIDLPLLAITTVLALAVMIDGYVYLLEALFLLGAYAIYFAYTILHGNEEASSEERPTITGEDYVFLVIGIVSLVLGATYVIDAVIAISKTIGISTDVIAITAVAVGTSLPELLVSARAARAGASEVALGNIFGSNIFNLLMVVGLPGLFGVLVLDETTLFVGVPALAGATFLFVLSGISRTIHIWEGLLYLMAYFLFVSKLFGMM